MGVEFLNFLYAERNREHAAYSEWGVTLWLVVATIIGLLGYSYTRISVDYEVFSWRLFFYYYVALGVLLISFVAIINPIKYKLRWHEDSRVTKMISAFPQEDMMLKLFISTSCFVFLAQYFKDFGPITRMFGLLVLIQSIVQLYSAKKGGSLVLVGQWGNFIHKKNWNLIYQAIEILICLTIFFTSIYTWGVEYEMSVREFELSCVFILIIVICWFGCSKFKMQKYDSINELIDKYLYGTISKKDTYSKLQSYSHGYDVSDILQLECDKAHSFIKQLEPLIRIFEEYRQLIITGKLDYNSHE